MSCPKEVTAEKSGRRSAWASTRGSLGRHRVEPLEQAAAPTDRAQGSQGWDLESDRAKES